MPGARTGEGVWELECEWEWRPPPGAGLGFELEWELEWKGEAKVNEGIRPELIGIVNYGIMGMIQLEKGYSESSDLTPQEAIDLYDKYMKKTVDLMLAKNHDYDEAWRSMRTTSYTDLILMKLYRTKQIEDNQNQTLISEGIEANYMDMVNYALFGLIKIDFKD